MYNLLNEKLFQVTANNREKFACSLPEVFAFLSTGETLSFSNLCFHQKQAWHAFLVQLGAISLHAAGEHKIPHTPAEWMELLRNLTRGFAQDEPWQLVVEDLSKPAFMQSPVPEGNLDGFGGPYYTPDENDILVTSKNHDVKIRRIRCPQPDHWIYSLVTLQTMQGYLGLGKGGRNYGISRMNGGYGSRPCVRYTSGLRWTDLFRRDLSILLEKRESLLMGYPFFQRQGGLALLWLEPWDGNESLSVECLDPFYIEVCRRLRLTVDEDRIVLFNRGSASNRVNAGELKGKTGDPWAPVDRAKDSVLTVGKNGFEYGLLQKLLFGNDYQPGLCQEFCSDDNLVHAVVLARGQGQTQGFHERVIPIDTAVRSWFQRQESRAVLGRLAGEFVRLAGVIRDRALKQALLKLLKSGKTNHWLRYFDREIDEMFFPVLWLALKSPEQERLSIWKEKVVEKGREILSRAEKALPVSTASRYKAVAQAQAVYERGVRRSL